jgi:hypothetical protein
LHIYACRKRYIDVDVLAAKQACTHTRRFAGRQTGMRTCPKMCSRQREKVACRQTKRQKDESQSGHKVGSHRSIQADVQKAGRQTGYNTDKVY